MLISNPGSYQVIYENLLEFASPMLKQPTGKSYALSALVKLVKFQENVVGVAEWGQLDNGNWIPTIQNSRVRVKFVAPIRSVAIATSKPPHIVQVNEAGLISIDGLPYE